MNTTEKVSTCFFRIILGERSGDRGSRVMRKKKAVGQKKAGNINVYTREECADATCAVYIGEPYREQCFGFPGVFVGVLSGCGSGIRRRKNVRTRDIREYTERRIIRSRRDLNVSNHRSARFEVGGPTKETGVGDTPW